MATLLYGSTFNGVRIWSGANNVISNTIMGYGAGDSVGSASADNTIVGFHAACDAGNTTYGNSVMGSGAFKSQGGPGNNYLCFNVAFGFCSMGQFGNDNVKFNTAVGSYSLNAPNVNCFNVAIGKRSMNYIGDGYNTFVGYYAGKAKSGPPNNGRGNVGVGKYSLYNISNGNDNLGVGWFSLCGVGNGAGNIAIGARAGNGVVNAGNTIAIGYGSSTSDNTNFTVAGNNSMTVFCLGAGSWTNLSDRRDKSDIEPIENNLGLNFIRNLRPVKFNFDYRKNYVDKCGFEYGTKDGTLKQDIETYGFIAQEMESTLEDIQIEFDALNKNGGGDYSLAYENLIAPIVKSLQQTIQRLELLESKV